jgi:hypothetical protein
VSWAETLSSSPWWKPWHQSGSSLTETIVIILSKGKWGITLWVLFELYLLKQNPQHLPEQATPPLLQDTLLWNSICPKKENKKSCLQFISRSDLVLSTSWFLATAMPFIHWAGIRMSLTLNQLWSSSITTEIQLLRSMNALTLFSLTWIFLLTFPSKVLCPYPVMYHTLNLRDTSP